MKRIGRYRRKSGTFLLLCLAILLIAASLWAEDDAELAKKLANPVSTLINVPIENNWDFRIGEARAMSYTANIKPVIPFSLSKDWNLITRTIVPVLYAESPDKGGPNKSGLGDIKSTIYFSPVEPIGGWFWGLGPGLIFPSATDSILGSEKWSGGPTGALVRQDGGWTLVLVAGQAWSFAGNQSRIKVNTTFLQPQASYTTKKEMSFGVNSQSSYDWVGGEWTMPLEFSVSQLMKFGGQSVSLGVAWRTYAKRPEGGPNWGLGFTVAFLFPK
jgi:hypothetical protein